MPEEKISKLDNVPYPLYTKLCYIAYIDFTIFMGFVFYKCLDYLDQLLNLVACNNDKLIGFIYLSLLSIFSTICTFKSIEAIKNRTFSLCHITILFLIIFYLSLPAIMGGRGCMCGPNSMCIYAENLIYNISLLVPLIIAMIIDWKKSLINKTFDKTYKKYLFYAIWYSVVVILTFVIVSWSYQCRSWSDEGCVDKPDVFNLKYYIHATILYIFFVFVRKKIVGFNPSYLFRVYEGLGLLLLNYGYLLWITKYKFGYIDFTMCLITVLVLYLPLFLIYTLSRKLFYCTYSNEDKE